MSLLSIFCGFSSSTGHSVKTFLPALPGHRQNPRESQHSPCSRLEAEEQLFVSTSDFCSVLLLPWSPAALYASPLFHWILTSLFSLNFDEAFTFFLLSHPQLHDPFLLGPRINKKPKQLNKQNKPMVIWKTTLMLLVNEV